MNDTPFLRRALAVATSLCFVAGVVAAVTRVGADDGGSTVATSPSASGSASPHDVADDGHHHSHAGMPQQASAAIPSTSLRPPVPFEQSADLGPPGDPGPVAPPKEGTYRYRSTIDGHPLDQRMVVERSSERDGGVTQAVVMETGRSKVRNDITWFADKAVLSKSAFDYGTSRGDCDWAPDITQRVLTVKAGTTWKSDSSCTVYFNGVPIKMAQQSSATVEGRERVRLAGDLLDVWRIEETRHSDFNGRASDATETTWFSPKHGLVVKGITVTSTKNGAETVKLETVSELQNLKPE